MPVHSSKKYSFPDQIFNFMSTGFVTFSWAIEMEHSREMG